MTKRILCCILLLLLTGSGVRAQDSYNDRAKSYIQKYGALAIEEQKRSGIPACITLGQGILETEAGASELMTQANNHFGIKCKSDYQGERFLHTDDAPMECFKKYSCAAESYKDHSDYLHRNPRYASLFTIKPTDYKSWAVCLRKCGYATNPQYAQNLIKIIEQFGLQDYTMTALDSSILAHKTPVVEDDSEEVDDPTPIAKVADSARSFMANQKTTVPPPAAAPQTGIDSSRIITFNDMKAFYAKKGEMLLSYAIKYKVRYAHLLEMNDLPDAPLPFNTVVYLEKKQTLGAHATHTVKEGESLLLISQLEGVQLKKLMSMNILNPNEEPVPGSVLYMQSASAIKPEVNVGAIVAHKTNSIFAGSDTTAKDDFIAINKKAPVKQQPVAPPPGRIDTVVAVVTPSPAPRIDTPKPRVAPPANHVIVVKTEEAPKPKVVAPAPKPVAAAPIAKHDTTSEEEFTRLKAELDKVVYADDSKLIAKTATSAPPATTPRSDAKTMQPVAEASYTVKHGDTAFSIAKRYNITVDDLLKMNNITASGIKTGTNLRVK